MNERVIFYIDGLNLYNGLKKANLRKYYWLDLRELARKLCLPNQKLTRVKYFTSMVSTKFDEDKFHRQSSYIKAIKTLPDMEVFLGRHQKGMTICNLPGNYRNCKNQNKIRIYYNLYLNTTPILPALISFSFPSISTISHPWFKASSTISSTISL